MTSPDNIIGTCEFYHLLFFIYGITLLCNYASNVLYQGKRPILVHSNISMRKYKKKAL